MNFPSSSHERFQSIHEEVKDEKSSKGSDPSVVTRPRDQNPPPTQSSCTLDQLWERFCSRWHLEDPHPTSNREAPLLERLERLSRLIHNTRGATAPGSGRGSEDGAQGRKEGKEAEETQRRVRGAGSPPSGRGRWEDPSTRAARHQHLCPADREEMDTVSTSGSISTVDTARLVRAFGAHRVELLKTSRSLRKLYSTIDQQRERREQLSLSAASEPPRDSTVSEFGGGGQVGFDGKEPKEVRSKRSPLNQAGASGHTLLHRSGVLPFHVSVGLQVSAGSTTSPGADSGPSHSHLGRSRTLTARKTVEVANKGIQAGECGLLLRLGSASLLMGDALSGWFFR